MKHDIKRTIKIIWFSWIIVMIGMMLIGCEPDEQTKTCYCETRADGVVTSSNITQENSDIICFKDYSYFLTTLGTLIETECGEL